MLLSFVLALLLAQTTEPPTAQEWYTAGTTRRAAGDQRGALDAFAKARQLGFANPVQLSLNEARAHAALGERDQAFAALQRAIDAGFGRSNVLLGDDELLSLRSDPRFKTMTAAADKNRHVCRTAEHRQFDYWLGEWDVEVNGNKTARSSIQLILDECVIYENYQTLDGMYEGKSFSVYDSTTKKWEQRYVDTGARLGSWTGGLEGDAIRFFTEFTVQGKKTTQRMTYTKEGPDRVRQKIESSIDGGKTWSSGFDGLYVRRK